MVKVANTSYTYDNAGRLTNIHHRNGDTGANIANYTYTYDNHSRLTSIQRNGSFTTYTYDDTDQLTGDGIVTVTYDANGNRTSGSYTVGTGNRLTSDGTWTYTYDDEGNLTKKSKGALQETWTYGYDQRNQLTTVEKRATDGGTLQLKDEFKYDAFGNRIEKKIDSDGDTDWDTTQRYALDGWKNVRQALVGNENWDVWADLDGSSSLTTRYVRGDVIDQLFARIEEDPEGDVPYWYLTDHLGSIRDVIDGSAVVKNSMTYDGFGNITAETDSNYRGRYAWTGREIDVEIELQYNRARYYDAGTGRWINQDPLGLDAGDGNLYRYVKNQSTVYVDPSGYWIVNRDNQPTAIAETEKDDTIGFLADTIGLNRSEVAKWLDGPATVTLSNGSKVPLTDVPVDAALAACQKLKIPNTVYALWSGENWFGIGKAVVGWNDDIKMLKSLGFFVNEESHGWKIQTSKKGWKGIGVGTPTRDQFFNRFILGTQSKQLHGFLFGGHGNDDGIAINESPSGFYAWFSEIEDSLSYRLALAIINSCYSDPDGRRIVSESKGALFLGATGLLNPLWNWRHPSEVFGDGQQFTNS